MLYQLNYEASLPTCVASVCSTTFNTDKCSLALVNYANNPHSCRGPTFEKKSVCLEAMSAKIAKTILGLRLSCHNPLGVSPSKGNQGISGSLIPFLLLGLCCTICVHSATRHNIHMFPYFLLATIHHRNRPRLSLSDLVAQSAE